MNPHDFHFTWAVSLKTGLYGSYEIKFDVVYRNTAGIFTNHHGTGARNTSALTYEAHLHTKACALLTHFTCKETKQIIFQIWKCNIVLCLEKAGKWL